MNTSTSPLYGGIQLVSDAWSVVYDCLTDDASVAPDAHAQAWTKAAVGSPVASAKNGMFSLATALASDGCLYHYDVSGFDTWTGAYMDALLYIPASAAPADTGAMIALDLGDAGAAAFLRASGVNLMGAADVPVDMTGWHWVRLGLQGAEARLWVDGRFSQSYSFSYLTGEKRATFGIADGRGTASVVWRYVRARPFWGTEELGSDALMMIGPYYFVVTDLDANGDGSSYRLVTVDHASEAEFTLAEPPSFTLDDGRKLSDLGILVEMLGGTDGSGFECKVTNLTYTGNEGYGSASPDIIVKWTRRGLVVP